MRPTLQQWTWLNDFARRGFRDIADQDYIAARLSYRSKLSFPFLWSSQQAIEKYLKAILLFNAKSTTKINHNLVEAVNLIKQIDGLNFQIPKECMDFVEFINKQGPNRYFNHELHLPFGALFELDKTVWNIRRFCDHFDYELHLASGKSVNFLQSNVKHATALRFIRAPHKYSIRGGLLEAELANKTEAAKNLVWKNFYYGRRLKSLVRNFTDISRSATPTHILHPEALSYLSQYAKFDKGQKPLKP